MGRLDRMIAYLEMSLWRHGYEMQLRERIWLERFFRVAPHER
jgi:hypothetical protein